MKIKRQRNHLRRSANKMVDTLIEKDHLVDCSPEKDNDNLCGSHLQSGSASQLKIQKP